MTDRVRVRNVTPYDIGLTSLNGIGYNVRAHMFQMMSREDMEYNLQIAPKLFEAPAQLVIEDVVLQQMAGIENIEDAVVTDAEIEKVLKGSAQKMKAFVSEHENDNHVIESLWQMAQKMDLPGSKLKVLKEALPLREVIE